MHILIVEDNADLAATIGAYCNNSGDIVDWAGDGLTGLHLAVANAYDALVLDLPLRALVRRARGTRDRPAVADWVFDPCTRIVRRGDRRFELTPTGLRILALLMRASPAVVRSATVERTIWGDDPPDREAALRSHIHPLRGIVDEPFPTKPLETMDGIGYRLAHDNAL